MTQNRLALIAVLSFATACTQGFDFPEPSDTPDPSATEASTPEQTVAGAAPRTSELIADMEIWTYGGGAVNLRASFANRSAPDSSVPLDTFDDELKARTSANMTEMIHVAAGLWAPYYHFYSAELPVHLLDDVYQIALYRDVERQVVNSFAVMPRAFEVLPTNLTPKPRSADIVVSWAPTEDLPMRYRISSQCLAGDLEGQLADDGQLIIHAGTLKTQDPNAECLVRVELQREDQGELSDAFAGGSLRIYQSRSAFITTVP